MGFICQQCGKCCRELPIDVMPSDLDRWHHERRDDILMEVIFMDNFPHKNTGGFYIEKTLLRKDRPKQPCPFLDENNLCSIYDTRPKVCRDYPLGYNGWDKCPSIAGCKNKRKAERIKRDQNRDLKRLTSSQSRNFLRRRHMEGRRGNFGD